jgi:thiol-disulfide isomerase/thioredoxin
MIFASLLLALSSATCPAPQEGGPLQEGTWRAWLDSPGGELPFLMEVRKSHDQDSPRVFLLNGSERIEVPEVNYRYVSQGLILPYPNPVPKIDPADQDPVVIAFDFPHYDSMITARFNAEGTRLDGHWYKRRGLDRWMEMPFHAAYTQSSSGPSHLRFAPTPIPLGMPQLPDLAKRYEVKFESSADPAIALFHRPVEPGSTVAGEIEATFLTTTGDYRYLAGRIDGDRLRLSVFDGAHAFLFTARLQPDEANPPKLSGDFWSSDRWHEKWTASANPNIQLPDAWAEVGLLPEADRPDWRLFSYPGLDRREHKLGAAEFDAKARLIVLFGTWCPNCHDESAYLKELYQRYHAQGLGITALAFEVTGDQTRDLLQIRRYRDQLKLPYPVLLAGVADKSKAAKAFPILSQVKSYPTTLFIDAKGKIRAVWSGFSGPATGAAHQKLRAEFESRIEQLLAEY